MSKGTCKYEDMLFTHQTTARTDFRFKGIKPAEPTVYKAKPTCTRIKPKGLKDLHTMTNWHSPIPFSLYHKPKDIIRKNPWEVQQPYAVQTDLEKRKEVIQSRPRITMTPAVAIDNVAEKERAILLNDIYTSTAMKGMKESAASASYLNLRAPLPGTKTKANPITLQKYQVPYVAPEWRMETVQWDQRQLRAHCDATKEFWLRRPVPKCRACDESAIVRNRTKI